MRQSECPEHGPYYEHYYRDEDTGAYTGRCLCGAVDPERVLIGKKRKHYDDDPPPF